MIAALRYEIARLRTIRSTWWLLVLTLFASAGITFAIAWGSRSETAEVFGIADILSITSGLVSVLVALVGVFSFGHEYRYGTIRPALTAIPGRSGFLAAKLLVTTVWAVIVGALTLVLLSVVVLVVPGQDIADAPYTWEPVGRVVLGYFLLLVLYTVVGLSLAGLFRNLPAALVTLLVFPLVVENILRAVLLLPGLSGIAWIGKYLPFGAGDALVRTALQDAGNAPESFQSLTPLAGGLTFGIFALALLALTWTLFERRDA